MQYVLPTWVIQVALFATPVAYSLDAVPANLEWLFNANPLTWLMECFRYSMLGTAAPPAWQIIGALSSALSCSYSVPSSFQRHETFADLI